MICSFPPTAIARASSDSTIRTLTPGTRSNFPKRSTYSWSHLSSALGSRGANFRITAAFP